MAEIDDPEQFLLPSTADKFSANMDKLFADDEKRSFSSEKSENSEKPPEKPEKPTILYKGTAFFESKSVGFVLSSKKSEKSINLVIYDKEKAVISIIDIDDVGFEFLDSEFVVFMRKSIENTLKLSFIDKNGFQAFARNVLIRSHAHKCFILSRGSAPFDISPETSILYDKTIHRTNNNSSLSLPELNPSIKTRLTAEKMEKHVIYQWLNGLGKGAVLLVKMDGEEVVYEISILKTKKTTPEPVPQVLQNPEDVENSEDESEKTLIAPTPTPRSKTTSSEGVTSSEASSSSEVHNAENAQSECEAPTSSEVTSSGHLNSEDVHDSLHRIIGIELDRIEMRLNAKFEQLKNDITNRLDQQTALLHQMLAKNSNS